MRIISGKYKGKHIIAPKNLPVRPTADRQKEALFNILANYYNFENIKVIDLCSGTGNIAFEFASRGTPDVTALDENDKCIQFITDTSKQLDLNINTIKSDIFHFLEKTTESYDLIFVDPPYAYAQELFEKIVQLVLERNLLTPEGMLIVEHSKQTILNTMPQLKFQRKYGDSLFSFFESR